MKSNKLLITANSDEISDDLKVSTDFFKKNQIDLVELRTISRKNIIDYSLEEIAYLATYFRKRNLKIASIASPLFKWYLNKPNKNLKIDNFYFNPVLSEESKRSYILKTLDIAQILDTKIIRVFSNLKLSNLTLQDVLKDKTFVFAIEEAMKRNVWLALENEPTCIVNSKRDIQSLVKKFKNLKICFDVANFYQSGEQVIKEDLLELKDNIAYFHIKDFRNDPTSFKYVPFGEGDLNYKRIMSDICSVFNGKIFLSLETHVKDHKINATQKSLDNLRKLITIKRIRYAIVGNGNVSIKHIRAIKESENSELRGFFDIDRSRAKRAQNEYDAICYQSLNALLRDADVDVVNICTPHDTHLRIALEAIRHNKKVLSEKPFVLSSKDLSKVLKNKKARENIFIIFQNNFNDSVQYLYKIIRENKLGKILYFSVILRWWREDIYFEDWHGMRKRAGGILFNQAIHNLEIINRILNLDVKRILAIKKTIRSKLEIEDILISIVELKGGVLGNIETMICAKDRNFESSIFLMGQKGSMKIAGNALNKVEYSSLKLDKKEKNDVREQENHIYGFGHSLLINKLSDYLLNQSSGSSDFLTRPEDMKKLIKFIEMIYKRSERYEVHN